MRWRQLNFSVVAKCSEAMFSLTGEDEVGRIEGLVRFNYLGRLMDRSDDNWSAVLHNISKLSQVWWRLGKILQREGAEPTVLAKFCRAVVPEVLFFGVYTWVLTETMSRRI